MGSAASSLFPEANPRQGAGAPDRPRMVRPRDFGTRVSFRTAPKKYPVFSRPLWGEESKTGMDRLTVAAPEACCHGMYCCADGFRAWCSRVALCPAPLRDTGTQAGLPTTTEVGTLALFRRRTSDGECQTPSTLTADATTGMTNLRGWVSHFDHSQQLLRLREAVGGRETVRRLIAHHEVSTAFEVEAQDTFTGSKTSEAIHSDVLRGANQDTLQQSARRFLNRLHGAARAASEPEIAADDDISRAGNAEAAGTCAPTSGLWRRGRDEDTPAGRQPTAVRTANIMPDSCIDTRRFQVLVTLTQQKEDGRTIVVTLKVFLDPVRAESWGDEQRRALRGIVTESARRTGLHSPAQRAPPRGTAQATILGAPAGSGPSRQPAPKRSDVGLRDGADGADGALVRGLPLPSESDCAGGSQAPPRPDAPWEARTARIFELEEFEVGSRRLQSTAMSFNVLVARAKHPRLIQAATAFMGKLKRSSSDSTGSPLSPLRVAAGVGPSFGGATGKRPDRPDSAMALLGHGKFSDWIPLSRVSCLLRGVPATLTVKLRFRRSLFQPERARLIREERLRAAQAGGAPLPVHTRATTHALTRFVFEVAGATDGTILLKQHVSYAELLASQRAGLVDLADDVIAAMEIAEGKVQEQQLEFLEALQESAVAEHEEGLRHVLVPSLIASRDEAARRIQEAVRRWRVRRRQVVVEELVGLLQQSPHARDEARAAAQNMHCATIRQWLTGVGPFSASTSMTRAITARRRAMGGQGRVFIDPVTGKRRVTHPTRPREPFEIEPDEPDPQVVDDMLAVLEEQVTMQALDGASLEGAAGSSAAARPQRMQSHLKRAFLSAARTSNLATSERSHQATVQVPQLEPEASAAGTESHAMVPNNATGGRGGARHALLLARAQAGHSVGRFHGIVSRSPRATQEADTEGQVTKQRPAQATRGALWHGIQESMLPPQVAFASPKQAANGEAQPLPDLPSASPAHFMPVSALAIDKWVTLLDDDASLVAMERQWQFFNDHRIPDPLVQNMSEGRTVYDADPAVAPLPTVASGMAETAERRRQETMTNAERAAQNRRRAMDDSLRAVAFTIGATAGQTQGVADEMFRTKDPSRLVRARLPAPPAPLQRPTSESMGLVLLYNEGLRIRHEDEALAVAPSGFGNQPALSSSGAMVRRSGAGAAKFTHGNTERIVHTAAIAKSVRDAQAVAAAGQSKSSPAANPPAEQLVKVDRPGAAAHIGVVGRSKTMPRRAPMDLGRPPSIGAAGRSLSTKEAAQLLGARRPLATVEPAAESSAGFAGDWAMGRASLATGSATRRALVSRGATQ